METGIGSATASKRREFDAARAKASCLQTMLPESPG
jgi:hypothetical protein